MQARYQHLGWTVSPYAQKTLAYLHYKQIPFSDRAPNVLELISRIRFRVGMAVMPTVIKPDGHWLQDSAVILDYFEHNYPQRSIIPTSNKQRICSHIFELIGDEWLIMSALHYRWSSKTSAKFVISEFARNAAPFLPKPLAYLVGLRISQMMKKYLPRFGVYGETETGVRIFTETLLQQLELHFKQYSFLLGDKPCHGDFALFGPIYAHLYRDPGSHALFDDKPALSAWIGRLLTANPTIESNASFLGDDQVPETLEPILQHFFAEQYPYINQVVEAINHYGEQYHKAKKLPRSLGKTVFTIGKKQGRRGLYCLSQWKIQRVLAPYQQASNDEKAQLESWFSRINGSALSTLVIKHPIKKAFFKEVFART